MARAITIKNHQAALKALEGAYALLKKKVWIKGDEASKIPTRQQFEDSYYLSRRNWEEVRNNPKHWVSVDYHHDYPMADAFCLLGVIKAADGEHPPNYILEPVARAINEAAIEKDIAEQKEMEVEELDDEEIIRNHLDPDRLMGRITAYNDRKAREKSDILSVLKNAIKITKRRIAKAEKEKVRARSTRR